MCPTLRAQSSDEQNGQQSSLQFNCPIISALDHWVAFPMQKDSAYPFGYIYLDIQAGVTLEYAGSFKITKSGDFALVPGSLPKDAGVKIRMEPGPRLLAFIPGGQFGALKIQKVPSWRKNYDYDSSKPEVLYQLGFTYNAWQQYNKALNYLQRAQQLNPDIQGLNTELAFAYNALYLFDSAELILSKEMKLHPKDDYTTKEYIYTASHNKHIKQAIDAFENMLKIKPGYSYAAESTINIMGFYYLQKDKANFENWYNRFQGMPSKSKEELNMASAMRDALDK
ncbi:Tetratricopeptide repeat-containing protein [Arachidicoccus rhizosphaerae]|jgi:tetratricopeptide (TPR) repeat protein|uniref:Tetratricopeptide repeat-containing protein n=2 Tax=Arachidicoccus rhizosphaerae TaxID=551991 RepID=A0A1H3ZG64_9BACT|nr:Tetratricopeptide repeat-containing protein [Arachidicoccus rhizosphaerae]